MEQFLTRIKCLPNIGELNEVLLPAVQDSIDKVHIAGGYSVLVPQTLIQQGLSINEFIDSIYTKIRL